MSSDFTIDSADVDGAIHEAADDLSGHDRATFLRRAGVAGGSLVAGGAFMGALPSLAGARPSGKHDVAVLNYALTLEYLEAEFYAKAVASGALSGRVQETAELLKSDEAAHVKYIKDALGGKAIKKPTFDFQGTTEDQDMFLDTAYKLENTGVRAYLGQAPHIRSAKILAAAATVATVEARHASLIAEVTAQVRGTGSVQRSVPYGPFDKRSSKKQIRNQVGKTGFIVHY